MNTATPAKCKRAKCNKMRYACAKTKAPFWLLPPSGPSGVRHRVGSKALNAYLWTREVMNHSSSSKGICSTALSCYRPDYRVSSLLQAQGWNFLQLVLRRHDARRVCQVHCFNLTVLGWISKSPNTWCQRTKHNSPHREGQLWAEKEPGARGCSPENPKQ